MYTIKDLKERVKQLEDYQNSLMSIIHDEKRNMVGMSNQIVTIGLMLLCMRFIVLLKLLIMG